MSSKCLWPLVVLPRSVAAVDFVVVVEVHADEVKALHLRPFLSKLERRFLGGGDFGGYRGRGGDRGGDYRGGGRGASHGSSRDNRSNPY